MLKKKCPTNHGKRRKVLFIDSILLFVYVQRDTESFRTPPRPTRLAMPPTPPESSPASTSEETTRQSPRRGRGRPRKSELTPPRVSRSTKVRARSRSGSPPVVTSTTEDLPAGTGDDDQKQTEGN